MLADEPVSAIDEHQSRNILQELSQQFSTLVVALHDTSLALEYCDRIIGLEAGRIVMDTEASFVSPDELSKLYGDEPLP